MIISEPYKLTQTIEKSMHSVNKKRFVAKTISREIRNL